MVFENMTYISSQNGNWYQSQTFCFYILKEKYNNAYFNFYNTSPRELFWGLKSTSL